MPDIEVIRLDNNLHILCIVSCLQCKIEFIELVIQRIILLTLREYIFYREVNILTKKMNTHISSILVHMFSDSHLVNH